LRRSTPVDAGIDSIAAVELGRAAQAEPMNHGLTVVHFLARRSNLLREMSGDCWVIALETSDKKRLRLSYEMDECQHRR